MTRPGQRAGCLILAVLAWSVIGFVAAAFWSGDWRWLLGAVPGILLLTRFFLIT